jgi:DNA invertase Pin-like site-specific DNA recombinase
MIIGYGRTSTVEQVAGLQAQIRDLKAAGAEKLFRENVSSGAPRKRLEAFFRLLGKCRDPGPSCNRLCARRRYLGCHEN